MSCRIKHRLPYNVLALSLAFCSGFLGAVERPEGFRSIPWGEHINNISGMEKVSLQGEITVYRRAEEHREIGGTEVREIEYYFFRSRFMGSYLCFDDFKRFTAIRNWAIRTYGPGEKKDFYLHKYTWWLQDILITLNYDARTNSGFLLYCYLPLWNQQSKGHGGIPD